MMRVLRFAVGLLSLSATTLIAGLLLIAAVVPLFTDWHRVVLTSGSMGPSNLAGDVVFADPDVDHPVGPGAVLVFTDPDQVGLVTHRVVEALPEGSYRTKGDANADPDAALVTQDMVRGQGELLVPLIGLPTAWVQQGHPERAVTALALGAALLWLCRFGLLDRYDPWRTASPRRRAEPRRIRSDRLISTYTVVPLVLLSAAGATGSYLTRGAFADGTDNAGNYLATAVGPTTYYLKTNATGNTSSSSVLPLSTTAPTLTTLYNYDTDRDSDRGLMLAKSSGLNETDRTKIQKWSQTAASPIVLSGNAKLRLWSAMKSFESKKASVQVGVYDCDSTGGSCTQFASGTVTSTTSWSGGSSTWVVKDWDLGTVSRTISTGRTLQVRVVVADSSDDDMWFAYDTTSYPSVLTVE